MMRMAVLFASCLILASCATPSGAPVPPAEKPAPAAPDPRLCAEVPKTPEQPAGASIVQPVTMEERVATALYLAWTGDLVDAVQVLQERARLAREKLCPH